MNFDELHCLSPLDGRYRTGTEDLRPYFSEGSLIKNRAKVEVVYLIKLVGFLGVSQIDKSDEKKLLSWVDSLGDKETSRVKKIESKIRHDVKAVEYLIREKLTSMNLEELDPWVHWGLTSEDVNNLAYGMMMQGAKDEILVKVQTDLVKKLGKMASKYGQTVMPGRTHGQLAVPTTFGKELMVFASRMTEWLKEIKELKLGGKLNGAVGNFNAHNKLFPDKDWLKFSKELVESLGLEWTMVTTQIEPGTRLVKLLDLIRQFNNVGLDLARDMWMYIAFDYLKQEVVSGEVGSSTMPQKVNPIDFENAEGNMELANGMLMVLANKLPISRMQRDLSDSTVKRNLGVAFGYSLLGTKSLMRGLLKVAPNREKLRSEIENHPEMLAEALQLFLKMKGKEKAYEKVKKKTRGKSGIRLPEVVKDWKTKDYVGLVSKIIKKELPKINKI